MSKPVIRIGTRESQLALWQAHYVKQLMSEAHPDKEFQIIGMTTMGDNDLIKPLSSFDSKGVFTKELDIALAQNVIDIAVHCMKDLATVLPEGQEFFATIDRGMVEDAVILHPKHVDAFRTKAEEVGESNTSIALDLLPEGAVVGTSALRRQASLKRFHPHLVCKDIRGNVGTRLSKLDAGQYDAIILARIGLERLGLGHRVNEVLKLETYQHAVGQGALAVVGRLGDDAIKALFKGVLDHPVTALQCAMERGMLSALNGGCKVPIAVCSDVLTLTNAQADAYMAAIDASREEARAALKRSEGGPIVSVATVPELPRQVTVGTDTCAVLTTRGCVMSLDGQSVIECSVAGRFESHPANTEETYATAWAKGQALGAALRSLGAEDILGGIRG